MKFRLAANSGVAVKRRAMQMFYCYYETKVMFLLPCSFFAWQQKVRFKGLAGILLTAVRRFARSALFSPDNYMRWLQFSQAPSRIVKSWCILMRCLPSFPLCSGAWLNLSLQFESATRIQQSVMHEITRTRSCGQEHWNERAYGFQLLYSSYKHRHPLWYAVLCLDEPRSLWIRVWPEFKLLFL